MDVTIRVDSCLIAEDGSHVLVNAVLPDGARVVDAKLPVPNTADDLARSLLTYDGMRYRLVNQWTGNVRIPAPEAPPAPAPVSQPAPGIAPVIPAPVAATEPTAEPTAEPTPVGVDDGAKGKQK